MDARLIPLNSGGTIAAQAIVDADDYERVAAVRWHLTRDGYACNKNRIDGREISVAMHRLVLGLPHGVRFVSGIVDHMNDNKLDNRKENLRVTTHGTNTQRGSRRTAKCGYRGVYPRTRDFEAVIAVEGSRHRLGTFPYAELAAIAYDVAARRYYGPHARVNFPAANIGEYLGALTMRESA